MGKIVYRAIVAFFLLITTTNLVYGQAQKITSNDLIIYENVEKKAKLFGSGLSDPFNEEMHVENMSDGQQKYKTSNGVQFFDPNSFAFTVLLPADSKYKFSVVTNKSSNGLTLGENWKTSFISPPRVGSKCPTDIKFEFDSTVVNEGTFTFVLNGKETNIKTITVNQEGRWFSPETPACGNDKGLSTIVYAPELGIVIKTEVFYFFGSMSVGNKRTLKEIKAAIQ